MEIIVSNLDKTYKNGNRALKGVNLEIGSGIFGLLGPNGAGKSSLIRILATLMKPSAGTITVNGLDLYKHRGEIRAMLGYLPQDFRFFPKLRTYEFLDYIARLAGMKDGKTRRKEVDRMLEDVGDRKSTRLNSSHTDISRMPSSA